MQASGFSLVLSRSMYCTCLATPPQIWRITSPASVLLEVTACFSQMSGLHAVISPALMPKPCNNLSKTPTNAPTTPSYICGTIILHNIVSLAHKVQLVHKSGIIFTYVKELVRKNLCLCAKNVMRPWQCHDYYCHRYKSISVQVNYLSPKIIRHVT